VLTGGGEERERPESAEDGGGVDDRRLGPATTSCVGDAGRQRLGHTGAHGSALYRGAGREEPRTRTPRRGGGRRGCLGLWPKSDGSRRAWRPGRRVRVGAGRPYGLRPKG
jgi:hypothetical protein